MNKSQAESVAREIQTTKALHRTWGVCACSECEKVLTEIVMRSCGETAPCELCDAVDHYMKECPPSPPTGRTEEK